MRTKPPLCAGILILICPGIKMHSGHNVIRCVLLTVFSVIMQLPHAGCAQTAATYHARADQALQSFLIKFWNSGQQYLEQDYPARVP